MKSLISQASATNTGSVTHANNNLKFSFRNHKEAAQFLHLALTAQWRQQKTLQTDTETKSDLSWSHFDNVLAHRFILASVSGFFKKQIEDDVVDLDLSPGASKELFEKIINFLYSGVISNVTQTIAREMLIICTELDIKRLSVSLTIKPKIKRFVGYLDRLAAQ